ncbi:MAG: hypothetical protein ABI863_04200 [Ginsengibacter sp.]
MYKQHLLNNIEREINICRRLYTKIPTDQINFRPKEGVRSTLEILQYLCIIGGAMMSYWLKKDDTDFNTFFGASTAAAGEIQHEHFSDLMDEQMATIKDLFSQVSEEDLFHREVTYPWGGTVPLGEGIISTSVKFLAAYKLQLFLYIKLSTDQKLGTADAWMLTDLSL